MLLESKGQWKKFEVVGDSVRGRFVSYDRDCPNDLGPQDVLVLRNETGLISIGCSAWLKNILRSNAESLTHNKVLTVTLTETLPPKIKGYRPMKVYTVDVVDSPQKSKLLQSSSNKPQLRTMQGPPPDSVEADERGAEDDDIPF